MSTTRGYRSANLERALADEGAVAALARVRGAPELAAIAREERRQLRALRQRGMHPSLERWFARLAALVKAR